MFITELCGPALVYIGFTLIQIIIDLYKNLYGNAFLKFIIMIILALVINILCNMGLTILAWFLVFIDDQPIGSVYLQDDNSIGMNLAEQSLPLVDACLRFVFDNFQPMQGKLSRVRKDFHINVPNENNELKSILSELDLAPVQVTYVIQALKG